MDPVLVILTSLLAIAIAALVFLKLRHSPDPEERALREALGEADMQQDLAEGEEAAQDEENEGAAEKLKGMSRIERRKYEKQQAKDQRRREVDAAIEDRKNRRDAKERQEEEERIQQRETEKKEQEALEEMRKEKARKADEEYQKWVGHIAVESRGEVGSADEVEERLLKTISNAADEKKVVVLDTTARELSIGVEKLVSSIEKLIADGKLSGVFDDRGKFICITTEEFEQVAKFMRQRGRVSVTELVRECNRIIKVPQPEASPANGITN